MNFSRGASSWMVKVIPMVLIPVDAVTLLPPIQNTQRVMAANFRRYKHPQV